MAQAAKEGKKALANFLAKRSGVTVAGKIIPIQQSVRMGLTDLSILSGAASPTHARGFERTVMRDPNARAAQLTLAIE